MHISNNNKYRTVNVLIDTGSQVSIINEEIAKQLGCTIYNNATKLHCVSDTDVLSHETSLNIKMPDAN